MTPKQMDALLAAFEARLEEWCAEIDHMRALVNAARNQAEEQQEQGKQQ